MNVDRDTIGEARRWLDGQLAGGSVPPLLVVIGLGDGTLLDALDRRAPDTRVLALEPQQGTVGAFRSRDWSRWFESGRLMYLVDPDYAGAEEAWRMFPADPDAHKLLIHPAVAQSPSPSAIRAAQTAKRIVFGARANAEARKKFAPRYLANTLRNLPAMAAGSDVRALTNFYRGVPAVIAAAGPSLDAVIDDLRATADRSVLIATGTALRPLLHGGLVPPLVVSLDPGAANVRHFEALPDDGATWLVAESALDRAVTEKFDGRTFWFRVANHHPWPWLNQLGVDIGRLEVWGSVLTAAFQVAVLAGCDPIVLVGADLSYTDGRPHARGVTSEFTWAYSVAMGEQLEHAWLRETTEFERIEVPDSRGRTTITSAPLQAFRQWMVTHAARSGRRVVNATGAGLFFGDGIVQSSLRDALPESCAVPSVGTVPNRGTTKVRRSELGESVMALARTADRNAQATAPFVAWEEFTSGAYDPVAVMSALDSAARALETTSGEPAVVASSSPWARLVASDATRGVLSQLPEGVARLRAELSAVTPLPDVPGDAGNPDSRTVLLAHAIDLLARIQEALSRNSHDLLPTVDAGFVPGILASTMYSWPERLDWTTLVFEALLGKALRNTPAGRDADYFARPGLATANPYARASEPHAARLLGKRHACALLAFEWLTCAVSHEQLQTTELLRLRAVLRLLEAALRSHGQLGSDDPGVTLVLGAGDADWSGSVVLPLPLQESESKRLLTGFIQTSVPSAQSAGSSPQSAIADLQSANLPPTGQSTEEERELVVLANLSSASVSVSVGIRCATLPRRRQGGRALGHLHGAFVTPHVLTEERITKSGTRLPPLVGGACLTTTFDANFALVTPMDATSSVLVDASGRVQQRPEWPRPIWGEVPWGSDGGALAWHNPDRTILWRPHRDAEVQEMVVPFRPLRAATGSGGLPIWAAFHGGLWEALPGTEPVCLIDTPMPIHLQLQADGIRIDPAVRLENGAPIRRRLSTGWFWRHGSSDLTPLDLGQEGQCTSVAEGPYWTASAHPYADVVRLTTAQNETLWLTCYYPLTVAWAGPSLVVATGERDVLFFHDLRHALAGERR